MRRHLIILISWLAISTSPLWGAEKSLTVSCGDWVEISAVPFDTYHFVKWNDGDTSAVRQIQVNESAKYIAFFADNCGEYANLPIVSLYDWLLMLDVRAVHDMGYLFGEQNVTWYRIVGEPDDMQADFPQDDQVVCQGYYLTLDRNLWSTGDYYAVVDVSATPSGVLCTDMMRTQIAHFAGTTKSQRLALSPTQVHPGQQMKLMGLDPQVASTICVYDMVGRRVSSTTTQNETSYYLTAEAIPGCYNVVVYWGEEKQTLRYLVNNQ